MDPGFSTVLAFPCSILICFTTLHLPSDNFSNEPHGADLVGVVGAGDAALWAGALGFGFGVGDDLFDGAADQKPACSHSIWTVNGRAISPTSAGDNCGSNCAVWYAMPLLSKNVRTTSVLSAKFTF